MKDASLETLKEKISTHMDAQIPIIYVNTLEEIKAERMIQEVAQDSRRFLAEWNIRGFFDFHENVRREDEALIDTLDLFVDKPSELSRYVLIIKDISTELERPEIVHRLKYLAQLMSANEIRDGHIVLLGAGLKIPQEIQSYTAVFSLTYLTSQEIKDIIEDFCEENEIDALEEGFLEELALAFKGMREIEIHNILSLSSADDGTLTRADLELILEQKQESIRKAGILEMIPLKESMEDIGGLENLKEWLQRKAKIFKHIQKAEEFGVSYPKGVLISGLPGCGKSLNAKAAAKLLEVPLVRLDMGKVLGKYVGESEQNMRKAIELADAISPCVLWIDELEKAFAGIGSGGSGNEVTTRLFGTFLTWMQEKDSLAFVVATANDITKLPPELLRKGRFDEIFYVGLPSAAERKKIFEIHIKKRRPNDVAKINLDQLSKKTDGYSGADIEGVIKDSIEEVFVQDKKFLTTEDILQAINHTKSLKTIMKDSLQKMEKVYTERDFKNASR